jgi:predicted transcriptional regulator YdeE
MPKMHINKSIEIDVPVNKVYQTISDFHTWTSWSPWLIMEQDAEVDVSDDGKSYSWNGKRVGSGEMSVRAEDVDKRVDMDLTFLKPWKSHAKVWWELNEQGGKTKVSWLMNSSIPWFMFWMKNMMTTLVGMDYDRGLNMLKDFIESGDVPTKLETEEDVVFEGTKYVGIRTECSMHDIGAAMEKDFAKLNEWIENEHIEPSGYLFSQYHKWDLSKGMTHYTSGIPVQQLPQQLPPGFMTGEIPPVKLYRIKHTGAYRHIGNAWSLGQNLARGKVFKSSKKIHPFETYANDPGKTPENELVTYINFPLR